jgi:hypothetical protein
MLRSDLQFLVDDGDEPDYMASTAQLIALSRKMATLDKGAEEYAVRNAALMKEIDAIRGPVLPFFSSLLPPSRVSFDSTSRRPYGPTVSW